jgi:hypothetical protein
VGYGRVKKLGGPGSEGGGMSDFGIVVFMFIFNLLYIAFFGVGLSKVNGGVTDEARRITKRLG